MVEQLAQLKTSGIPKHTS